VPPAFVEQGRVSAAQAFVARGHLRDALEIAPNSTSLVVQAGMVGILPKDSVDRVVTRASAQPNGQTVWAMLTWLAAQRDVAGVRRLLDRLGKTKSELTPATIPAAFIALARGDTAAAIHDFTLPDSVCLTWCPVDRLHLARMLAARGEDAKAAALYDQDFASVDIGKIMWMLDRGRVNQRLGNRQKAIDSFAYVVSAWQNPDPELKPYVDEARRGLSALRSDAARQ
jgi:hypothetical protein